MVTKTDRFVVSYSGGKDAILALHRAVEFGMRPVGAMTMFDRENECSWFHRLPKALLKKVEDSLEIPFEIIETGGDSYAADFEKALNNFKKRGADSVVFGDIDIQEHRDWCDERCRNTGLKSFFPLWRENRKKIVEELIDTGFRALITTIDTTKMHEKFLGETLTKPIAAQIIETDVDVCGENGEYHTFVYDGPLFHKKIEFEKGSPITSNGKTYIPLR